jgi:hypothetical protein
VAADEPDNRIVECAVEANSQCILTEDKHLLRLGEYEGIKIVRVRDFLERGRVVFSPASHKSAGTSKPYSVHSRVGMGVIPVWPP